MIYSQWRQDLNLGLCCSKGTQNIQHVLALREPWVHCRRLLTGKEETTAGERRVRWPGSLGKDAALRQVVGRVIRRQNISLSQPAIWFGVDTVLSENPLK